MTKFSLSGYVGTTQMGVGNFFAGVEGSFTISTVFLQDVSMCGINEERLCIVLV